MRSAPRWFAFSLLLVLAVVVPAAPAPADVGAVPGVWSPPVPGRVVRGFDPPATPFGPGHLGVDFAAVSGTPVRAAGDGTVVFAGFVGTSRFVVVLHPGSVRTTAAFLATIAVVAGQVVHRGAVLGTSGGTGPGHGSGVLHFSVRVGGDYVDPMRLFAPPDLAAVVHLVAPLGGAAAAAPNAAAPSAAAAPSPGREWPPLAAELRVDGRRPAPPPAWWGRPSAPVPVPVDAARPGAPAAASGHFAPRPAVAGIRIPTAAVAFGGGSVAGLALHRRTRRRRRARVA